MKTVFLNLIFIMLCVSIACCKNVSNNDVDWHSFASDSSSVIFANALTNRMSPTDAAAIYVDWLSEISTSEQGAKAKEIIRAIVSNYGNDSLSFTAEVDRISSTLPPATIARIATLTSTPTEIARWMREEMPSEIIDKIDSIYAISDSTSAIKFRQTLNR